LSAHLKDGISFFLTMKSPIALFLLLHEDMTVVIREDRVSDIGKAGEMPMSPDATVVDASGKFLIPGLWDMHVHWYNQDSLTLFTANGVTGVREMFGNSDLLRWRDEIAKGSLTGHA